MKHIFLFGVLLFSLLAVCNCKHDLSTSHVMETQGVETGKGENPDNNPGQTNNNEPELPEVIPPEVPPEIVPPEVIPPVVIPPEGGTQETETEEGETQEIETTETETEEGEVEEDETQDDEAEEGKTKDEETGGTETYGTALLQINELRTEYSTNTNNGEYIEFKVTKGGSMEGLYLYSVMNNAQDIFVYIFPEIDVETGEYITLHLQTFDKFNCCDELRDDLTISEGCDSCLTARDLWVTGNGKYLDKTGIVYIQDYDGRIMDAVVLHEKPTASWNSNQAHFAEITERLFIAGMWQSSEGKKPTPLDAVNTSSIGTSPYKTVSRYENRENTHSAKDWYIAGYLTPGLPNK